MLMIVLEARSKEFFAGLPWELFYANDLCSIAETEEELMKKIKCWKGAMKLEGLRVIRRETHRTRRLLPS